MAISQNIFWLGLKSKVFCGRNKNNGNLGQGNESTENGSGKNTPNFIRPIFPIGLPWTSVIRDMEL